jgi:hypothetical protein
MQKSQGVGGHLKKRSRCAVLPYIFQRFEGGFQRFEGGDRSCPQDISCPSIASVFLPIIWAERMGKRKTSIQEAQAHV